MQSEAEWSAPGSSLERGGLRKTRTSSLESFRGRASAARASAHESRESGSKMLNSTGLESYYSDPDYPEAPILKGVTSIVLNFEYNQKLSDRVLIAFSEQTPATVKEMYLDFDKSPKFTRIGLSRTVGLRKRLNPHFKLKAVAVQKKTIGRMSRVRDSLKKIEDQDGQNETTWTDGMAMFDLDDEEQGTYIGPLFNGLAQGRGNFKYDNGDIFTGEFHQGQMMEGVVYVLKDGFKFTVKSGKWTLMVEPSIVNAYPKLAELESS